jgi:hypothetical protein
MGAALFRKINTTLILETLVFSAFTALSITNALRSLILCSVGYHKGSLSHHI